MPLWVGKKSSANTTHLFPQCGDYRGASLLGKALSSQVGAVDTKRNAPNPRKLLTDLHLIRLAKLAINWMLKYKNLLC